jgi:hypothetical protein
VIDLLFTIGFMALVNSDMIARLIVSALAMAMTEAIANVVETTKNHALETVRITTKEIFDRVVRESPEVSLAVITEKLAQMASLGFFEYDKTSGEITLNIKKMLQIFDLIGKGSGAVSDNLAG